MKAVVALEDGLEDIGKYLEKMGFKVVKWGHQGLPVNALVYKSMRLEDIQSLQILDDKSLNQNFEGRFYGVLLINAKDKNPVEIYEIIKKRIYEDLV